MIRRCFAHVGQALFTVERHCEHTVVFDCGGEDQSMVKKAISNMFRDDEIIDILFISHYDSDHINGIRYLLENHTVRHIVLPMIEEPIRTILVRQMHDSGDREGIPFVSNSTLAIDKYIRSKLSFSNNREIQVPRIHFVRTWTEEASRGLEVNREEDNRRVRDIDEVEEYVAAGVALTINRKTEWCKYHCDKENPKCQCHWIYFPFNRQVMTSDQLQTFWFELGLPENATNKDVLDRWEDVRRRIKGAWSAATGLRRSDINDYSMTVYAGCSLADHFNACLYTGDYNAKSYMKELKQAYKMLWDNIRIVQIPHHGSWKNFHKDLIIHHGAHIISNRNQPRNNRQVDDTAVINSIISQGEYVAKTSHKNIYIPDDFYWDEWYRWDCRFCGKCRCDQ